MFFVLSKVLHYKSAIFYNVFVFVGAELAKLVLQITHKLDVLLAEKYGLLDSQLHFFKFSWDHLSLKFSVQKGLTLNMLVACFILRVSIAGFYAGRN